MYKKYILAFGIAVFLVFSTGVSALASTSLDVATGYPKGNSTFDVVVHATPKEEIVMYVNGNKSGDAQANKKGWRHSVKYTLLTPGK